MKADNMQPEKTVTVIKKLPRADLNEYLEFLKRNTELTKAVDKTIKKWYYGNSRIMKLCSMDVGDVLQHVKLDAMHTAMKFNKMDDISRCKLVTNAVQMSLTKLYRLTKKKFSVFSSTVIENPFTEEETTLETVSEDRLYKFCNIEVNDWEVQKLSKAEEIWKIAYIVLSDKELEILKKIIMENTSFEQAGELIGTSKQYVSKIYLRSLKKIRSFIKKNGIFWKN